MKTKTCLLILSLLGLASSACAEVVAGPNGGRLLPAEPHAVEFFVTPEQHAELTFFTADQEPAAAGDAQVNLIAEPASGRTRIELEPTPHGFRSTAPLPEGAPYRIVVQVRAAEGERPQNFRVDLNLHNCGECGRAEYACTCEGH